MNVKVTADSTCDLSPALLARYDITLAPLTVIKDGTSYADGLTITPQEIFSHVAAGGSLCSTAAVSVGEYQALFSRFAGSCDGLVHITIGSGFAIRTPVWRQQDFPMSGWWIPATSPQARATWSWRPAV